MLPLPGRVQFYIGATLLSVQLARLASAVATAEKLTVFVDLQPKQSILH